MAYFLLPNQPALFESEAQQSPLLHNIGTRSCGKRVFFKYKASAILLKFVFNVINLSYFLPYHPAPFESEAQQHLLTSSPPPILKPSSTSPSLVPMLLSIYSYIRILRIHQYTIQIYQTLLDSLVLTFFTTYSLYQDIRIYQYSHIYQTVFLRCSPALPRDPPSHHSPGSRYLSACLSVCLSVCLSLYSYH